MKNLRLKSARAAKDLSQEQLAALCNVSRQTISAIEKGDYNPTINLCVAICKARDKTLDERFREEEHQPFKPSTEIVLTQFLWRVLSFCQCFSEQTFPFMLDVSARHKL